METSTIGFTPLKTSKKGPLQKGTVPDSIFGGDFNYTVEWQSVRDYINENPWVAVLFHFGVAMIIYLPVVLPITIGYDSNYASNLTFGVGLLYWTAAFFLFVFVTAPFLNIDSKEFYIQN